MARGPAVYRSQLIVQLRRVWGVYFARLNARLKLARVHSAQDRGLPTPAGRGRSHTTARATYRGGWRSLFLLHFRAISRLSHGYLTVISLSSHGYLTAISRLSQLYLAAILASRRLVKILTLGSIQEA